MTKTTLFVLLGGLGVVATPWLSDTLAVPAPAEPIAWEQPPGVPPRPGGGIIIKAAAPAGDPVA